MQSLRSSELDTITQMLSKETNCNKSGRKGHYAKVCRQKYTNNQTVKKLTEQETDDLDETSSESEESIHHIGEIKKIEEKNKHYTATVKKKGKKKEFIFDVGSPITIMPRDEKVLELPGIEKIINTYQDVNKNEVKFRVKIPIDVEYENNKQKVYILITKRTEITRLLGMD